MDEVERGRIVPITPHGKVVARLAPEAEIPAAEVAEAIKALRELRYEVGKAPRAEILASRHEGHKY